MVLNEIGQWGIQAEMGSLHTVFYYDYVIQYGTYFGRLGPDPFGWFDGSAEAAMKTDFMKNHGYSEADSGVKYLNRGAFIRDSGLNRFKALLLPKYAKIMVVIDLFRDFHKIGLACFPKK